ncbi:hypothetical protein ARMGADRAFT_1137875, partial [Armillaria gallica]
ADLPAIAVRTVLMGMASWLDILVLAPGMHQQQSASEVNHGKFPKTGPLVNRSIFHVENLATVSYLQHIGCTGYLITTVNSKDWKNPYFNVFPPQYHMFYTAGVSMALLYLLCPMLTIVIFALMGSIRDRWVLAVLGMIVLSRTINVFVIKQRASDLSVWKGAEEEGREDLLIVLYQDHWIRLQGDISDIKHVMAGQWLQDED